MGFLCHRLRASTLLYTCLFVLSLSYLRYVWKAGTLTQIYENHETKSVFDHKNIASVNGSDKWTTVASYTALYKEQADKTTTPANSLDCTGVNFTQRTWGQPASIAEYTCRILDNCEKQTQWPRVVNETNLCPCFPHSLVGKTPPEVDELLNNSWTGIREKLPDVLPGGYWTPTDCVPRRRVAIIIPYRDREMHLRAFMGHMHPILQHQLIEYRIFVVEQNLPYTFNKASIMNIGFVEAVKQFNPDCVLFNDVDTLIERDDNMVVCEETPVHFAAYSGRHHYHLNENLFGSAILLKSDVFAAINGFSNMFFGWGGEDDDIRNRIRAVKMSIYKGPKDIARCSILKHDRDVLFTKEGRKDRLRLLEHMQRHKIWHDLDGLNSLRYDIVQQQDLPLYTWILADVKKPVVNVKEKIPSFFVKRVLKGADKALAEKVPEFSSTMGRCLSDATSGERYFLSRVTCRYICGKNKDCDAMEYHSNPPDELDSYCVLTKNCPTVEPSDTIEIYTKY